MSRFKLVSHIKVLKLLSDSKAIGLDKISGKILKIAAPTIPQSLTHIFNHAIITSCFPHEWKVVGQYHFTKRVHEIVQKIIGQSQFYLQ
jgi:hypothetical protein